MTKKSSPKSINKWQNEIEEVFDDAFRGIPMKNPRSVTAGMLENLVFNAANCYRKFRKIEGKKFSIDDAVRGSEQYYMNRREIPADSMAIAAYLWAHEFNGDISHGDGVSILKSLESRLGSIG